MADCETVAQEGAFGFNYPCKFILNSPSLQINIARMLLDRMLLGVTMCFQKSYVTESDAQCGQNYNQNDKIHYSYTHEYFLIWCPFDWITPQTQTWLLMYFWQLTRDQQTVTAWIFFFFHLTLSLKVNISVLKLYESCYSELVVSRLLPFYTSSKHCATLAWSCVSGPLMKVQYLFIYSPFSSVFGLHQLLKYVVHIFILIYSVCGCKYSVN